MRRAQATLTAALASPQVLQEAWSNGLSHSPPRPLLMLPEPPSVGAALRKMVLHACLCKYPYYCPMTL